ncbi:hypothetical protein HY636_04630 [Candidatus Woesearchaeota archaeon]|nr:hypothetical protein [Candidatus Woesearchaeota archaeon]
MNAFDEHLARYRQEGIEYLRANLPEIQRVESLDDLKDLKLTRHTDIGVILMLQYEATAPTLFPAVRQRLMDAGVAKRHNMLHTSLKNEGTPDEVYNVTMGFYGAKLQISLDVHK